MIQSILNLITELIRLFSKLIDSFQIKRKRKYTFIEEENIRVEAYDFLKQVNEKNITICPTSIFRKYKIYENTLIGAYITEGYAIKNNVSGIEHTITSSKKQTYNKTICYGYDLLSENPQEKIIPSLISPDGVSKVVKLLLNKSINKGEHFKEKFVFELDDCVSYMHGYCLSGINYKRIELNSYDVVLKFYKEFPENVRVYEIFEKGYKYLHTIYPVTEQNLLFENGCVTFLDCIKVNSSFSIIIFIFDREKEEK
ncbi:MAG: hypothetical protein HFH88_01390 [Lachnospiraceae bacterium]|jgi:hypothetical protein|nr:hypothetical protein [Lachnospiraceae bacterium]